MKHVGNAITTAARKALVTIEVQQARMVCSVTPTPGTKALFAAIYGVAFTLFAFAPVAHAQQTLADSMNSAGQTVDAGKILGGKIGMAVGFLCFIGCGFKIRQRSTEGENSQVKMGTIIGLGIAAVFLAGAGAMLYRAGASIGLQTSDYGTVPGN